MGPKKGKAKIPDSVDGVDTSKMNREQLEVYTHKILEEMEREREERNFFQLEKDKIRTFWEITRHQLDETRAIVRNKEREKEELSEKHEQELLLYKQKVKHLMYEHQTNLSGVKAEHMLILKMAQDDNIAQQDLLFEEKRELKKSQEEMQNEYINKVQSLKLANAEEMSNTIKKFESDAIQLEQKYEQKLASLYDSLNLKHRVEISQVEERKNAQISQLIENHEKSFAEMKNYYSEITLNNLSLIKNLKEQMEQMKNHEERMIKQVKEATSENRKYSIELKEARIKVNELSKKLINREKDKQLLICTRKKLSSVSKDLENLKWENEVLEMRFNKCRSERDELHSRFVSAILELQQKTGLKNVLLEKKMEKLLSMLEQKEAEVDEILAASQLDPVVVSHVNHKLEEMLNRKNNAIKDLQYELDKVSKAHDDLLANCVAKLQEYGIPETELRSKPLRSQMVMNNKIRSASSALVTVNP